MGAINRLLLTLAAGAALAACAGATETTGTDPADPGLADCPPDKLVCTGDPDGTVVCRCDWEVGDCSLFPDKCQPPPHESPPSSPPASAPPAASPPTGSPPGGSNAQCVPGSVGALLGPAAAFNVFVLGDLDKSGSDTEGRMAVGGNAKLSGYSVGTGLANSQGARDDLVVGGSLAFYGGSVPNGNAVYGLSAALSGVSLPNGTVRQDTPVDFVAAGSQLKAISAKLAAFAADGTTTVTGGLVALSGNDSQLNVFAVKGADLSGANALSVSAPAGATVIINVSGSAVQLRSMGFTIAGTDRQKVLFNFPAATSLLLEGVGIEGSLLAPLAQVDFVNGANNGVIVAGALSGPGENHEHPFDGCTPQP